MMLSFMSESRRLTMPASSRSWACGCIIRMCRACWPHGKRLTKG
jgi:hypothetical protein